jgi:CRISPR-associated protein Csm2
MDEENIVEEIKEDLPDILAGNSEKLVEDAKKLGERLGGKLSTSQIRNIFSEVKKMQSFEKSKTDLILLRPKLAYTAGRHGKMRRGQLTGAIVDLQEVLDAGIQRVDNEEKFENFQIFFEAILAYHRYYGGKE